MRSFTIASVLALVACGENSGALEDATPDVSDTSMEVAADVMRDSALDDADALDEDTQPQGAPVLVALGALGRTLRSCDNGRSWQNDTDFASTGDPVFCGEVQSLDCSAETPARWTNDGTDCEERTSWDCDHTPGSSMGLVFDERFVATFGWGAWATTRVSDDGVNWRVTRSERLPTPNRLHLLRDRIFGTTTRPIVSMDHGETWQVTATTPDFENGIYNIRAQGVVRSGDDERIWMLGRDRATGLVYSDDGGDSWTSAALPPEACLPRFLLGFYHQGDSLHLLSRDGDCTSADGGETWTQRSWEEIGAEGQVTRAYQVGDGIVAHGAQDILRNLSGNWERFDQPHRWANRVFYFGDDWISIQGDPYSEGQVVRRSEDGVRWTEDPESVVPPGHPIRQMVRGWVEVCE